MQLGEKQKKFIDKLRTIDNNRQCHSLLGETTNGVKKFSALGIWGIIMEVVEYDIDGNLVEKYTAQNNFQRHYKDIGLHNPYGVLKGEFKPEMYNGSIIFSLWQMNDYGKTFKEIADFIESNPSLVFAKSI